MLQGASKAFKADLANVCESHNLDDIENIKKYKTFVPYGPSPDEVCNLLFVAVYLRTIDLLQITNQRAPSIMFRLINPTDPISQVEWIKQNKVTGVFVKELRDKDGHIAKDVQADTISIFAKYDNENGFFGLTSYLRYAEQQLIQSYNAIKKSFPGDDERYSFPWQKIDDQDVDAEGFDPRPYQFNIDQAKILDLLTGHTLYNESSIAIRELVQNSLDAVRLQCQKDQTDPVCEGRILVTWESVTQILTITDNGTGMTQETIEKHLLSVGSSRYQDPIFKEQNPKFNSISRFGIGVLSAFMVADTISIITFSKEEGADEFGRQLSLRSVHGKYLMRLVGATSEEGKRIGSHGTIITIKLRASSKTVDVLGTLQRWIVLPRCRVEFSENGEPPIVIGSLSPKAALEEFIRTDPEYSLQSKDIEVISHKEEGLEFAVAMRYSKHYREKTFVQLSQSGRRIQNRVVPAIGLCVEGIRVDFHSPGAQQSSILTLANCFGPNSPRTNVSRSALDNEASLDKINKIIFDAYLKIVENEIDRLQKVEAFSLSYATNQFPFIGGSLYQRSAVASNDAFADFPMFIVEQENGRKAVSLNRLLEEGDFWTVESTATDSLMEVLKDVRSEVTAKQVSDRCGFKGEPMPAGSMVTNLRRNWLAQNMVESAFEVGELKASILDRRLDAKWVQRKENARWTFVTEFSGRDVVQVREELRAQHGRRERFGSGLGHWHTFAFAREPIAVAGLDNYIAANVLSVVRLIPGTTISRFFENLPLSTDDEQIKCLLYIEALSPALSVRSPDNKIITAEVDYALREIIARYGDKHEMNAAMFLEAVRGAEGRLAAFEPFGWRRGEGGE